MKLKLSSNKGFSFGLVSGIITTLGLIIGLDVGTQSTKIVLLGVLTIGFADGLSDAIGIHISEESDNQSKKKIWSATISAFLSKLFFALTFVIPLITLDLGKAVIASVIYGLIMIGVLSYYIGRKRKQITKTIIEHVGLTIIVMIGTYFIGIVLKP